MSRRKNALKHTAKKAAPAAGASKKKAKTGQRSSSRDRKEHTKKANMMAKKHKQKLLDAKVSRQRQRNRQIVRLRRKMEQRIREQQKRRAKRQPRGGGAAEAGGSQDESAFFMEQQAREDGCGRRFCMALEDLLAAFLYFLTVTLRSERTFDWIIFLANNLGLYQEYEINDYGQRLSPRTGRPVLLSLGPFRVVQVVESANQVRSHWDPYIRAYLRNSKLTTDCWRANRMALQVALCMDETGRMFDMPIHESAVGKMKEA